jgi:Bacterial Ig domain
MSSHFTLVLILAALCVCVLLVVSWNHHDQLPREALAKLPYVSLDTPHTGDTLRGTAYIAGWAAAESGIEFVAVYIDRDLAGFAKLGVGRPDVGKAFPWLAGSSESGWRLDLDTSGLPSGRHEILVQARTKQGATRDAGAVTVTIAR